MSRYYLFIEEQGVLGPAGDRFSSALLAAKAWAGRLDPETTREILEVAEGDVIHRWNFNDSEYFEVQDHEVEPLSSYEARVSAFAAYPFKSNDPLGIVRHFTKTIQNGRTVLDIARHTEHELAELYEEIGKKVNGQKPGSDGIVGESIDIIACALDAIFVEAPETTNDEICALLLKKCEKWARRYKDSVDGDRSID